MTFLTSFESGELWSSKARWTTHADEWMVQVEKIFKVFECTRQQKVQLAAFMFRSVANTWWHTIKATYIDLPDDVVWDRFKTTFFERK